MGPAISSAMVRPPEADPVRAESTLVATASETRGPPPIPSTHSRTTTKDGSAATTAPNPTRLATLRMGSTEAFTPASIDSRNAERRARLIAINTTMAAASAVVTAHTPPTAAIDVAPHFGSARKLVSMRGKTRTDISRLTPITTPNGSSATPIGGRVSLCRPWPISAGSNSRATDARSRRA